MDTELDRMERALANADLEETGVYVPEGLWSEEAKANGLVLVGRLLTDRRFHFAALRDTFTAAFKAGKGLSKDWEFSTTLLFLPCHRQR